MKKVYSSFCGSGKSYLCNKFPYSCREIECWLYRGVDFPNNYVEEVLKSIDEVEYLFISTDPVILKELHKTGIEIELIYAENSLRNEYLDRYIDRDSPYDFIGTTMKNWSIWIDELKEQDYCNQIVLKSGEYVGDILTIPANKTEK